MRRLSPPKIGILLLWNNSIDRQLQRQFGQGKGASSKKCENYSKILWTPLAPAPAPHHHHSPSSAEPAFTNLCDVTGDWPVQCVYSAMSLETRNISLYVHTFIYTDSTKPPYLEISIFRSWLDISKNTFIITVGCICNLLRLYFSHYINMEDK